MAAAAVGMAQPDGGGRSALASGTHSDRQQNEGTCRSQTSSGDYEHTWRAVATSAPGEQPELSFEQRPKRKARNKARCRFFPRLFAETVDRYPIYGVH
jgi:hypothetical protein